MKAHHCDRNPHITLTLASMYAEEEQTDERLHYGFKEAALIFASALSQLVILN